MNMLGCLDLDHELRLDRPMDLIDNTTAQRVAYKKWEQSNCMCLIPKSIRGGITKELDTKSFLKQISNQFAANEKAEISTM